MTKAQRQAVDRLKKKHGPVINAGTEPDGKTIRVRLLSRDVDGYRPGARIA